jgi:transposase
MSYRDEWKSPQAEARRADHAKKRKQVIQLQQYGLERAQIASRFGVSVDTIRNWLREEKAQVGRGTQ